VDNVIKPNSSKLIVTNVPEVLFLIAQNIKTLIKTVQNVPTTKPLIDS